MFMVTVWYFDIVAVLFCFFSFCFFPTHVDVELFWGFLNLRHYERTMCVALFSQAFWDFGFV